MTAIHVISRLTTRSASSISQSLGGWAHGSHPSPNDGNATTLCVKACYIVLGFGTSMACLGPLLWYNMRIVELRRHLCRLSLSDGWTSCGGIGLSPANTPPSLATRASSMVRSSLLVHWFLFSTSSTRSVSSTSARSRPQTT